MDQRLVINSNQTTLVTSLGGNDANKVVPKHALREVHGGGAGAGKGAV